MNPALAYALMPGESFAQKRADSLMMLQLQQLRKQQYQQDLAEKDKALSDTQATLDLIANEKLLPASTARLNQTFTERWRSQMENELVNEFGGDIVRFRRERQPYLAKRFANELVASPEYRSAVASKTNYALAQDAISKGKVIVGNFDSDWQAFNRSPTEVPLSFAGAYEPPKGVLSYFDENAHPTTPFKKTAVTASDIFARALNQGLGDKEARDYLNKLGYQGGRYWKQEQQKPWDAAEQANQNAYRWATLGETKRHNHQTEARASEANKLKAQENGLLAGVSQQVTPAQFIFDPSKGGQAKPLRIGNETVQYKDMPGGKVAQAIMQAAGINKPDGGWLTNDSGSPNYNTKAYTTNIKEVYSPDFRWSLRKSYRSTGAEANWQVQEVDPSRVYYRPGQGYAGSRPFIKGVVLDDQGLRREAMISLDTSELSAQQIINYLGFGTTKAEATQGAQTEQTRRKTTSGGATTIDSFLKY
jgi:hypothetical protein